MDSELSGCEPAWLAAYALGLATAGRDDRAAVCDLAQGSDDPEHYCEAIRRLSSCSVGQFADRQRAIDLLTHAAAVAGSVRPRKHVVDVRAPIDTTNR